MHRRLKDGLRSRLDGQRNWLLQLPLVLLGHRTTPNYDTGITPAVLVYGQNPELPGQLAQPQEDIYDYSAYAQALAQAMNQFKFSDKQWHGGERRDTHIPPSLVDCEYVLVRVDKIQPSIRQKYAGPYRVLERHPKTFKLQLEGRVDTVSIDRLKPFHKLT